MTITAATSLITVEEFLALPDDGVERDLIYGVVREYPGKTVTRRNRRHSRVEANIVYLLKSWLSRQPMPRGEIHSGEVGCILRRGPDLTVGIDVAYFSREVIARCSDQPTTMIEGAPVLAIEILSPSDVQEEIDEKIDSYLANGTAVVWIVDPHFQTVRVHRLGEQPILFNVQQELAGDPLLPGFCTSVTAIFES
jgi:Uma2 family endonuclease